MAFAPTREKRLITAHAGFYLKPLSKIWVHYTMECDLGPQRFKMQLSVQPKSTAFLPIDGFVAGLHHLRVAALLMRQYFRLY